MPRWESAVIKIINDKVTITFYPPGNPVPAMTDQTPHSAFALLSAEGWEPLGVASPERGWLIYQFRREVQPPPAPKRTRRTSRKRATKPKAKTDSGAATLATGKKASKSTA